MVTILVGGQWGDEGKGKIVSYLCKNDRPDIIARAGVGPNAGHTVVYKGTKYPLRLTPSGFLEENARLLIGAGILVNPDVILGEIKSLGTQDRIGIDMRRRRSCPRYERARSRGTSFARSSAPSSRGFRRWTRSSAMSCSRAGWLRTMKSSSTCSKISSGGKC